MRLDRVVPVRADAMPGQIDLSLMFGGDLQAGMVSTPIQICANAQAGCSACGANELEYCFEIDQWLSSPIGFNMTKELVLNRVPFRRGGGQMRNRNRQIKFVGQLLEPELPQPDAVAIRTATVGFDQQLLPFAIPVSSHPKPPFADRRHGECWRLVRGTHHHETFVARDVEDTIQREVRTSLCGIATPSASLG